MSTTITETVVHKSRHLIGHSDNGHRRYVAEVELSRQPNGQLRFTYGIECQHHAYSSWTLDSWGRGLEYLQHVDSYGPGWSRELLARFLELGDRWHLNDMQAGCAHQREMGWDKLACPGHHKSEAETCLGELGPNGQAVQLRILGYPDDRWPRQQATDYSTRPWTRFWRCVFDPVSVPCPVCGYGYGTRWLYQALPEDVVAFMTSLPNRLTRTNQQGSEYAA